MWCYMNVDYLGFRVSGYKPYTETGFDAEMFKYTEKEMTQQGIIFLFISKIFSLIGSVRLYITDSTDF